MIQEFERMRALRSEQVRYLVFGAMKRFEVSRDEIRISRIDVFRIDDPAGERPSIQLETNAYDVSRKTYGLEKQLHDMISVE
jgi:hypothetical protein